MDAELGTPRVFNSPRTVTDSALMNAGGSVVLASPITDPSPNDVANIRRRGLVIGQIRGRLSPREEAELTALEAEVATRIRSATPLAKTELAAALAASRPDET